MGTLLWQGAADGRIDGLGFDGLVLDLDELWAEADRLLEQGEDEFVDNDEP